MFGLLKKKITSFIDGLTKKEEQKDEAEGPEKEKTNQTEPKVPAPIPTTQPKAATPEPVAPPAPKNEPKPEFTPPTATPSKPVTQAAPRTTTPPPQPATLKAESDAAPKPAEKPPQPIVSKPVQPPAPKAEPQVMTPKTPEPITTPQKPVERTPAKTQTPTPINPQPIAAPKPIPSISNSEAKSEIQKPESQKPERKLEAKLGILSQIKGLITREVEIQPTELEPMLDELNMALLESDVTLDTADHIVATIKNQLAGKKVDKGKVQAEIQAAVRTALIDVLNTPPLDLIDYIRSHDKPVKILFLGPNGAGKTTTLAKITHYLKQNDVRCVLAAADTFRAAAIEQLQHHGAALQVPVIKHQYGADPAAVAFDAIAHAKAHNLDVVLIDTAGRQETNYNLLKEMEKINRVVQPDLKLFIGEAVAGHALVEQAKAFHQTLKLDGVVLTKVDCDAKGGTSFSVSHEVGVPIVLLGTGQNYGDIRTFDAGWLVSNVLAE